MTDALTLYGTDEPIPPRIVLMAGPLSAVLEAGQLRDIRWHGVEVLRGIAWLSRNASWGTMALRLSPPEVTMTEDAFRVRYIGTCTDLAGAFTLIVEIDGSATGRLSFRATATVTATLTTNRTGFVVLHPDTAAGLPLTIRHADRTTTRTCFPKSIMADQPAFEVVGLTHRVQGVKAEVAFDGGIFEMEDQRNWMDASFKTYVRPLRLPKPYVLPTGAEDRQDVHLNLSGTPMPFATPTTNVPRPVRVMPRLWLRASPGLALPRDIPADLAQGLIARVDLSRADPGDLRALSACAGRLGWGFGVEALFPMRDTVEEAREVLSRIKGLGVERLLIAGTRDLKSRPSASLPPYEAPLAAALAALRDLGFAGLIGAGTPSFFTEFNRNPPPPSDFAWFGGAAIVHAADEISVFETAGVIPAVLEGARALVPGTDLFPGPLTIAPVNSPYAPNFAPNPGCHRVCMAQTDPRHSSAVGAAYLVAVMARLAGRVSAAAPMFLNGPSGCVADSGELHPVGLAHAVLAGAAGSTWRESSSDGSVARLTWLKENSVETGIAANTSATVVDVMMNGWSHSLDPFEVRYF